LVNDIGCIVELFVVYEQDALLSSGHFDLSHDKAHVALNVENHLNTEESQAKEYMGDPHFDHMSKTKSLAEKIAELKLVSSHDIVEEYDEIHEIMIHSNTEQEDINEVTELNEFVPVFDHGQRNCACVQKYERHMLLSHTVKPARLAKTIISTVLLIVFVVIWAGIVVVSGAIKRQIQVSSCCS
jgi:hypothetical protein